MCDTLAFTLAVVVSECAWDVMTPLGNRIIWGTYGEASSSALGASPSGDYLH